jgi:ubiquinone/menaquinone biosynthesis C-methylase UbiE
VTRERGRAFGRVAEEYDRVRSSYPAALVDEACAGLAPGSRVVEVGSGTGKLTVALVEHGLEVDAVEPDADMAAVARRHVGDAVSFHIARFEDVELPERAFETVFSATAFHWIDPEVGWQKAARLLRPGGTLALLTHVAARSPLSDAYLEAWRAVEPESAEWVVRDDDALWAGVEERRGNVSEVWDWLTQRKLASPDAAALFEDVRLSRTAIVEDQVAERSIERTRTSSAYLALDDEMRARLEELIAAAFDRLGGTVPSTHYAVLVTARAATAA